MKKTYIAPASQLKTVAAQQMVALSMVNGADGNPTPATPGAGDEDSDGLVKSDNIWDTEW